ncbi:MAG: WD40 repeat domain-containing protein [Planctomycetes bacterium]|nr:WD40 repeat domain-containing protein [Planctomycetota bacterium]
MQLKHAENVEVRAVAFSEDGALAATAGSDSVARVWKLDWTNRQAELLQELAGHKAGINSVQFSHDAGRLLTGSQDRTARLWEIRTGRTIRELLGHYEAVSAAVFAPRWKTDPNDPRKLLFENGRRVWESDAQGNPLPESMIVTASEDGTAVVWLSKSGNWLPDDPNLDATDPEVARAAQDVQQSTPFRGHGRQPVYAAAFSPRGDQVVTGGYDQRVLVWDPSLLFLVRDKLENVKLDDEPVAAPVEIERELVGHTNQVRSVTYSADGQHIVSGSRDNTVKVWELGDSQQSSRLVTTFRGHDQVVQSCVIEPEGRWVLSGSHDARVKKWSIGDYAEARIFDLKGREFEGHGGTAVLGASFSKDGGFIVTAGQDRRAARWDVGQPQQFVNEFVEGHEYLASSAVFARSSRRLLTGAVDNTVRLWDVATGGEIDRLEETGRSAAMALSPDEKWILTGGESRPAVEADRIGAVGANGDLRVWKAQLWQIVTTTDEVTGQTRERVVHRHNLEGRYDEQSNRWLGHLKEVSAVAFSSDAKTLITCDQKGNCLLWSWSDREQPPLPSRELAGHNEKVVAAVFLPKEPVVLTASRDGTVAAWDTVSGRELADRRLPHDRRPLVSMALSDDGQRLLTATEERTVHLWDVRNAREISRDFQMQGGKRTLEANVKRLVEMRRWDEATRSRVQQMLIELNSRQQAAAPAETEAVAANTQLPLASLSLGELAQRFAEAFGFDSVENQPVTPARLLRPLINSVSISPDGALGIGANNEDGIVHLWDLETGELLPTRGGRGLVWSVLFAPYPQMVNGRQVYDFLTVGGSGAALWNYETGRQRMTFSPADAVASAFFSPDGRYVVTASWDNSARIWDTQSGKDILKLEGHQGQVNTAGFSTDGSRILTASDDGTVRLWQIDWENARASVVWQFDGHRAAAGGKVSQAVFSPNGRLVVTAGSDGTARLLNAADGRELCEPLRHLDEENQSLRAVLCAAFSSDSLRILTGCDDRVGRVWDISSDEPVIAPIPGQAIAIDETPLVGAPRLILKLSGHTAAVTAVAFSPENDSSRALTGSRDNTVKVWDAIPREAGELRGQEILTLKGHTREVTSVQFSPNGRDVLTASKDGSAIVWLTESWSEAVAEPAAAPKVAGTAAAAAKREVAGRE